MEPVPDEVQVQEKMADLDLPNPEYFRILINLDLSLNQEMKGIYTAI